MAHVRALLLLVLIFVAGCATGGHRYTPSRETSQTGLASYYGREFQGRRTASGEAYDGRELTGAHRTLAFGTRVRVTNVGNGRSVVVRINDRGPFRRSRVIDLSRAAAYELAMLRQGIVRVRVDILGR